MTRQLNHHNTSSSFSEWIRKQPTLDSAKGYRAYDTDLNLWNKNNLCFAKVEEKCMSQYPSNHQMVNIRIEDMAYRTCDNNSLSRMLSSQPYFGSGSFEYRGYWFIQYERRNLTEGSASVRLLKNDGDWSQPINIATGNDKDLVSTVKWILKTDE